MNYQEVIIVKESVAVDIGISRKNSADQKRVGQKARAPSMRAAPDKAVHHSRTRTTTSTRDKRLPCGIFGNWAMRTADTGISVKAPLFSS